MPWEELESKTGQRRRVENPEFDEAVRGHSPILSKEETGGPSRFIPVQLQPVISYGLFEGEFGSKGPDLIFHFWPYKFREDSDRGRRPRSFPPEFEKKLLSSMSSTFGGNRVEIIEDLDMGSFFVRAYGFGEHDFAKSRAVDACRSLHLILGGSEG